MNEAVFLEDSTRYDWLQKLDLRILVAGHAEHQERWPTHEEFRGYPYFRLYCVTEGRARLGLPDGERILSAPHSYLLPAQVPLRYLGGENFAHFWVHFFARQLGRFGWFSDVREADFPAGAALLTQLLEAMRPGAPDWNRAGELDRLLRQLLQPFLAQAPEPTESERTPPSAQMAGLVDYIDRHLAEKLTVAALAQHCRMTPEQLSDAFFAAYGMRPKHYLCLRRITQARRLLVTGKLPIKEIGRRVGYENVLFFHRQFRRYTGLTPAAYRACERTGE